MSRLRPHLSFSNVVALIALFAALGGSAYAVKTKLKANQVKSKHIAPDAATGEDVNEGTLGNVPSATNATNAASAANADNAAAVGGVSVGALQFGDGEDTAVAGVIEDLNGPGPAIAGISLIEGNLGFDCDSAPTLEYTDDADDGGIPTDIWINGEEIGTTPHQELADGAAIAPVLADQESTHEVQLWGGGGWVANVTASIKVDTGPVPNQCIVAFTSQENTEAGPSFGATGDPESRDDREALPEGWVPLEGGRR